MKLTHLKRPSSKPLEEAGPFSYGAKTPRKGSVRDIADKKRKEQDRATPPVEPRDQMVGTAKVQRNLNEGPFGDALKSMKKTYQDVVADPLDKTGKREAAGYVKQFKDEFIRWSYQTQGSDDPNNVELILKFLETQKGFTPEQIAALKKVAGVAPPPAPATEGINMESAKLKLLAQSGVLKEQLSGKEMFKINKLLEQESLTWEQIGFTYKKQGSVFIRESKQLSKTTNKKFTNKSKGAAL